MFTINLIPSFIPLGDAAAHDVSRPFPSGAEVNFRLDRTELPEEILLTTRMTSSDDLMKLLLATDAARRCGARKISVFISYFAYARQDRACSPGEAFSLHVVAGILNAQHYERVTMFDPHSDVTPAVVNNSLAITNISFAMKVLEGRTGYIPLSPDAGAEKKVRKLLKAIDYKGRPALCSKYRVEGGNIEDVEISVRDFEGHDVFIFDDICEGGATYIGLANEIRNRNAGKIYLVVSHGIFSAGFDRLKASGIAHIFTTDSFRDQPASDYVTEIKLCTIL